MFVYSLQTNSNHSIMKLLLAAALLFTSLGHANSIDFRNVPTNKKEKTEKSENSKEDKEEVKKNRNIHSVKKWKMTIEYTNGNVISKTIVVNKNSEFSALDMAFEEAEKHLKNIKKVKNYSISPVSNSYVLLAGD